MTLRHTTPITFTRKDLDDWGLTTRLGLSANHDDTVPPAVQSHVDDERLMSSRMAKARNLLSHEFRKAVLMSSEQLRVQLDINACDVLAALMIDARVERDPQSEEFDQAIGRVQSTREELRRTADAWRSTDAMPLETLYFTAFEDKEVCHWMAIYEAENDNDRRDFLTHAERLIDIRLHDQWYQSLTLGCITGDRQTFGALRAIMQEANEVAQGFDEASVIKYGILLDKLDAVIESLEELESDELTVVA